MLTVSPELEGLLAGRLTFDSKRLADLCDQRNITQLEIFGSVLRDDFNADRSDVDVMISTRDGVRLGFDELLQLEKEFSDIFGRRVDVLERRGIEQTKNEYRRGHILATAQPLYVEG